MAQRKVYLPLCGISIGSCQVEQGRANPVGVSVDEKRKQITIRIRKPSCDQAPKLVKIRIPKTTDYDPFNCDMLEECLEIGRDPATFHVLTGAIGSMEPYPYVKVYKPDHCQWEQTSVTAHLGEDDVTGELFAKSYQAGASTGAKTIAVDVNTKSDCKSFETPPTRFDVLDNNILVPGIRLKAHLFYSNGKQTRDVVCGQKYYRSCSMSGGIVKAIVGDYDTVGIQYMVEVEGAELLCTPSDFVDYEVGDWVFVMSIKDACDVHCDIGQITYEVNVDEEFKSQSKKLLGLINQLREENGKKKLVFNEKLSQAAQGHAKDMISNDFFSHTGTGGTSPHSRIAATGYGETAAEWGTGENLAKGQDTAEDAFSAWLHSPGHYRNMIDSDYKEAGLSIIRADNGTIFWVNTFGYIEEDPEKSDLEPASSSYVIIPFKIGDHGA